MVMQRNNSGIDTASIYLGSSYPLCIVLRSTFNTF
jgi:hypothetical protein